MSSIVLDIIYGAAYESTEFSFSVASSVVGLHATGPGTPYDTPTVFHSICLTDLAHRI